MGTPQAVVAYFLAALLTVVAGYYGRQQFRTMHELRGGPDRGIEDRRYFRNQAWRRLFGCVLLGVVAAMLVGAYASGLQTAATELGRTLDAEREQFGRATLSPEQLEFRRRYALYWASLLVVLFILVGLAGVEWWAVRRFGRRHWSLIRAERRAALVDYAEQRRRDRRDPPTPPEPETR